MLLSMGYCMWKINFLPHQEIHEKSYRRFYAALIVGILLIAVTIQLIIFYWYRNSLLNIKQHEDSQSKPVSSLSIKKQCDEKLPEGLTLRAIFIVNQTGKVMVEDFEGEIKIWEKKNVVEKTCWAISEINSDHIVLFNNVLTQKIEWYLGELLK